MQLLTSLDPFTVLLPHVEIDFASPAGANPPVDEGSVKVRVLLLATAYYDFAVNLTRFPLPLH